MLQMSSELLSEDYVHESLEQYLEVEQPRAMLKIVEVELQSAQHLLYRVSVAIVERSV